MCEYVSAYVRCGGVALRFLVRKNQRAKMRAPISTTALITMPAIAPVDMPDDGAGVVGGCREEDTTVLVDDGRIVLVADGVGVDVYMNVSRD